MQNSDIHICLLLFLAHDETQALSLCGYFYIQSRFKHELAKEEELHSGLFQKVVNPWSNI